MDLPFFGVISRRKTRDAGSYLHHANVSAPFVTSFLHSVPKSATWKIEIENFQTWKDSGLDLRTALMAICGSPHCLLTLPMPNACSSHTGWAFEHWTTECIPVEYGAASQLAYISPLPRHSPGTPTS